MTLQERMLIEAGFLPKKMNKDENEPSSLVSDEALSFIENQLGIDRDTFLEIISDEASRERIYEALLHCVEDVPELSETASQLIQFLTGTDREDEDPSEELDWITIKGTHVPLDDEGNITGNVADKIKETSKEVKDHLTEAGAPSSDDDFEREGYHKNAEGHWEKAKFEISDSAKPKNSDYDYDPKDSFDEFSHKNVPKLKPIYKEKRGYGIREEWFKTRLQSCTGDFKELSDDEIDAILDRDIDKGKARLWLQEYDHNVKPAITAQLTMNPEVHNAALNIMYKNYASYCKYIEHTEPLPFDKFLVTPIKMYRGGSGKEYDNPDVFSSYTFDKSIASQFRNSEVGSHIQTDKGKIYEAEIRPIDTYGSLNTSSEMEIFVPGFIAPNGKYDSAEDINTDADDDDEDWVTIKGTHVLIDEHGVAQSGGKLKGKTFKDAKSQKKPAGSKQSNVEHVRNVVMKLAQMKRPRMSDYETYEEFEEARNTYKKERDNLRKEVAQYANDSLNRESKYDSMEKVRSWAEGKGIDMSGVDEEKVDTRIFKDVCETYDEMLDRFPEVMKANKEWWSDGYNDYPVGIKTTDKALCYFDMSNGVTLGISAVWGRDYLEETYVAHIEEGIVPDTDNPGRTEKVFGDGTIKTSIRHEFGHAVDFYIRHRLNPDKTLEDLDARNTWDKSRFKTFEEFKEWSRQPYKLTKQYEDELRDLTLKHSTSVYSTSNYDEAFAEGFAEYTSNPGSEYGRAFGEFLKRWYPK